MTPDPSPQPAGLSLRLAAMAYDWLLLAAIFFMLTLVLVIARGGAAIEPGTPWFGGLLLAASCLFYGWFWTHGGQTLGLRAWKLRVVKTDGGPLSWPDAMRRFAASLTLLLPPGLGLAWMWISPRRAAWHDLLSGTRIVRIAPPSGRRQTGERRADAT